MKRLFDIVASGLGLIVLEPTILNTCYLDKVG